jgi:hypothetical protein
LKGVIFFACCAVFCAPAAGRELTVLPAGDEHVDIVYEMGQVEESAIRIGGTTYSQWIVADCPVSAEPGEPGVRSREFLVGIPLDAEPTIEVLGVKRRVLRGVLLAPAPRVVLDSLGFESYVYETDDLAYARPDFWPSSFASLRETGFVRNQRVACVVISVTRYDPLKRVIEFYDEVRVRVRFNRSGRGAGSSRPERGFDRVYESTIANHAQSAGWRKTHRLALGAPKPGDWVKLKLVSEGLYGVKYCDLDAAGVPVDVIDPRTFVLLNGGSRPLPESLSVPRPDSTEVAIYVEGEEDGRFDPSDHLLFYGIPLTGYSLDTIADTFSYFMNPYADTNVYWLGWGVEPGPRMATVEANPSDSAASSPARFTDRVRLEEEVESPVRSGLRWIWHRLRRDAGEASSSFTTEVDLAGVASSDCSITLALFVESDSVNNVRIYLNDELIHSQPGPGRSGKYDPAYLISASGQSLTGGKNLLKVELAGGTGDSLESVLIDYFEITYSRRFELDDGRLSYSTEVSPQPGVYEYRLNGAESTAVLLDVTDPFRPIKLSDHLVEGSAVRIQVDVAGTQVYYAANRAIVPPVIEMDSPHNLKSGGADYLAISYELFTPAVSDLISWRNSNLSEIVSPSATLVGVSDVFDNFSWGVVDPTAIRDFLAWTLSNWTPAPTYCLLVGASTYDYKNNLKLAYPKNFIPPHVEGYVVVSRNQFPEEENFCYDDWFVWLTPGDRYADMFLGRFDAVSGEEARILTLKALSHERDELLGVWRKQCLLVADDQETYSGDAQFTRQCETIDSIVPADIDVLKVYMAEYSSVGEEKPQARDAMIECINKGVLSGAFLGHGNIKQLAHEKVFRSPEDVDRLTNGRMTPFFYYGSCSVGLLDRPTASSMGSLTSKGARGGNLVSLAASRPTYGGSNAIFANALFGNIYGVDSLTTAGEVIYSAKLAPGAARAELYILYGDPGVRLGPPALRCSLSVVPDSMVGLSTVTVQGVVTDPNFEGWAMVRAFDSAHMESDTCEEHSSVVNYELSGEPFYWSLVNVKDGRFTHSFRVPKIEARSIREGEDGRVSVYLWSDDLDVSGAVDSIPVGGNQGPITDLTGPEIRLLYDGEEVSDSISVRFGSKLSGIISDESGIYLGARPDKIMRMVVNGDELNSVHLNELFDYDQGNDTLGRFIYTLELAEDYEASSLRFVASDNFLNTSECTLVVVPVGPDEMAISSLMNYPNPFDRDTYFTFVINQPGRVTVRVYTIGGRLVKTLTEEFDTSGYQQVYWDGRDEDGDIPSNGVYLYKVTAKTSGYIHEVTTSSEAEEIGKLLIVR